MAALGQQGEMFGNLDPRSPRGDGTEFPANGIRGLRFGIERVVLRRAAGKEYEYDRFRLRRFGRGAMGSAHRPNLVEMVDSKAEKPDASRLEHRAPREDRMAKNVPRPGGRARVEVLDRHRAAFLSERN